MYAHASPDTRHKSQTFYKGLHIKRDTEDRELLGEEVAKI